MSGKAREPAAPLLPAALLMAVLTTGLVAGVFADWAHTIMPGLGATDARVFVEVFQVLDRAILTPVFLLVLMGAVAFIGLAVLLSARTGNRPVRRWATAALVLYVLAAVVITMTVHEPLNAVLRNAGDPARIADPAALRAAFDESRWAAWHLVRTIATTAALACLAWALVLTGRRHPIRQAPKERTT